MPFKSLVRRLLGRFGFDVVRRRPQSGPPRDSMAGALSHLRDVGWIPRTIIDVGVADGTPELYEAFPESRLLLVEPLAEFEPALKRIAAGRRADYVLAAASDRTGTATIHVHTRDLYGSSLLREAEGEYADGVPREIPTVRLDEICRRFHPASPYLLKLDVQGAERRVLEGAPDTLRLTEVILMEVFLFGTLVGSPQFADHVAYMRERGFVPYDIAGPGFRPLDGALSHVDMVFVPENGIFRREHGFATREQREQLWTRR